MADTTPQTRLKDELAQTIKEMYARPASFSEAGPRIVEKQAARSISIHVAPEALAAAVTLTSKYVKDRQQPDKSIDALDLACARAVVSGHTMVRADDIAEVISEWTGIPARQLNADEKQRFANMERVLRQRVVGQQAAISAVCNSLRTALAGMKQPNRPIGVFLFLGPSGVGKTQLAKELAAFLFHTPDALIRFDMNEYQEKYSVNNLIGSARGYLGSEQGGQFTEALRKRPFSVVLLDEMEKAHSDIWNLFLSVFDEGRITDNQGRLVRLPSGVLGPARLQLQGTRTCLVFTQEYTGTSRRGGLRIWAAPMAYLRASLRSL